MGDAADSLSPKIASYSNGPQMRDFLRGQIFGTIPPLTTSTISNPDLKDRTIIITGANSGLGLEAAKQFAQLDCMGRLILACRNVGKGEDARKIVLAAQGNRSTKVKVDIWALDMSSRSSIRAFAERVERELDQIDAVVLNAGVDLTRYEKVGHEDGGYEMTLMVNVVGTIVLTCLMVPVLRRKSTTSQIPRITIVGSSMQFVANYQIVVDAAANAKGQGILDWLSDENRWKDKIGEDRYFLSKGLVQMVVGQVAQTMLAGAPRGGKVDVIVNCVNPGWCRTQLFRDSSTLGSKIGLRLIGRDADVGARALLIGAVGVNGGSESHGGYMSDGKVKPCCAWFETDQGRHVAKMLWEEVLREVEATKGGTLDALQYGLNPPK